jgi:hypothetical protein
VKHRKHKSTTSASRDDTQRTRKNSEASTIRSPVKKSWEDLSFESGMPRVLASPMTETQHSTFDKNIAVKNDLNGLSPRAGSNHDISTVEVMDVEEEVDALLDIHHTRELPNRHPGSLISVDEADALRQLVFGRNELTKSFPSAWTLQGFYFNSHKGLEYGLVQKKVDILCLLEKTGLINHVIVGFRVGLVGCSLRSKRSSSNTCIFITTEPHSKRTRSKKGQQITYASLQKASH